MLEGAVFILTEESIKNSRHLYWLYVKLLHVLEIKILVF